MIKYLKDLISFNGNPSSKRFVGILASLALITYMFIWPSDASNNTVLILALGCLSITGFEKFIPKKDKENERK